MKWIRKALKGISLTAAMFVFQACYGTEPYYPISTKITFHVVSDDTHEPLHGITVMAQRLNYSDSSEVGGCHVVDFTDENGLSTVWTNDFARYSFVDKDSVYVQYDTIMLPDADTVEIVMKKII